MERHNLTPEQLAHLTGTPVWVVMEWLNALIDRSDVAAAWPLTDGHLRLALVQSWVWGELGMRPPECEALADRLVEPEQPQDPAWKDFARWLVERWRRAWPDYVIDPRIRGWVGQPQTVAVDLEGVMLGRGDTAYEAGQPVEAFRILVRHSPEGVRVAGVAGVLPIPGWPPTERQPEPM